VCRCLGTVAPVALFGRDVVFLPVPRASPSPWRSGSRRRRFARLGLREIAFAYAPRRIHVLLAGATQHGERLPSEAASAIFCAATVSTSSVTARATVGRSAASSAS